VRGRAGDIRRSVPEWELLHILLGRPQPAVGTSLAADRTPGDGIDSSLRKGGRNPGRWIPARPNPCDASMVPSLRSSAEFRAWPSSCRQQPPAATLIYGFWAALPTWTLLQRYPYVPYAYVYNVSLPSGGPQGI